MTPLFEFRVDFRLLKSAFYMYGFFYAETYHEAEEMCRKHHPYAYDLRTILVNFAKVDSHGNIWCIGDTHT